MVYCLITCLVTGYSFPSPGPFLLFPAMVFTPHFDYLAGNKVYCMFWSQVVCSLLVHRGELGLLQGRRCLSSHSWHLSWWSSQAQVGTRTPTWQFLLQRRSCSQEPSELCFLGPPEGHEEIVWAQRSHCISSKFITFLLLWHGQQWQYWHWQLLPLLTAGCCWVFTPGMDIGSSMLLPGSGPVTAGALCAFLHTGQSTLHGQQPHSQANTAAHSHTWPTQTWAACLGLHCFGLLCFERGANFCMAVPPSWHLADFCLWFKDFSQV